MCPRQHQWNYHLSPTEALLSRKQQESLGDRAWLSLYASSPLGAAEIWDSCKVRRWQFRWEWGGLNSPIHLGLSEVSEHVRDGEEFAVWMGVVLLHSEGVQASLQKQALCRNWCQVLSKAGALVLSDF